MKTITINGEYFELTQPRTETHPIQGRIGDYTDIYEFYNRPSQYKTGIWSEWLQWAHGVDGLTAFNISSANCFAFTISGCVTIDGITYNLYITRDHNRAIQVNSFI